MLRFNDEKTRLWSERAYVSRHILSGNEPSSWIFHALTFYLFSPAVFSTGQSNNLCV